MFKRKPAVVSPCYVLGIDISTTHLHLLKVSFDTSLCVQACERVPIPQNVVQQDFLASWSVFLKTVRHFLKKHAVMTMPVVMSFPDAFIVKKTVLLSRTLTLPEIEAFVVMEAEKHAPVFREDIWTVTQKKRCQHWVLSWMIWIQKTLRRDHFFPTKKRNMMLDFQVLAPFEKDNSMCTVNMIATREGCLRPRLETLRRLGAEVRIVEPRSESIARAMRWMFASGFVDKSVTTLALMEVTESSLFFCVLSDGMLVFTHEAFFEDRGLSWGGLDHAQRAGLFYYAHERCKPLEQVWLSGVIVDEQQLMHAFSTQFHVPISKTELEHKVVCVNPVVRQNMAKHAPFLMASLGLVLRREPHWKA